MDDAPLAHDWQAGDLQDRQAFGGERRVDGMTGYEGDAEPGDHCLFDGLVTADLHADAWLDAGIGKEAFHKASRAAAGFANEKNFVGKP